MGIARLSGKVTALSEHGGVLPADTRVEVVLADPVHHVLGGAMEQMPFVHYPVEASHFFGHILLFPFIFLPKKLILHSQNFQNFVFGLWHSLVKQVINGSIAFIFLQNRHLDEVLRWIHTNPGFRIEVWRGNSSWR